MLIALITMSVLTLLSSILMVIILRRLSYQSNLIYLLIKKFDSMVDKMDLINEDFNSLTTSLLKMTKANVDITNVSKENKMPDIDLSNKISQTIQEQIKTEYVLNSKLRVPHSDSFKKIIYNTIKTYPDVDDEWIIKRCFYLMELFVKNN